MVTDETDGGAEERWAEAARQVNLLRNNGQPIRGLSLQSSLIVTVIAMGALAAIASPERMSDAVLFQMGLFVLALILGVSGYEHARRHNRLLPFSLNPTGPAIDLLTPEDRKALSGKWRSSEPLDHQSAPLISAFVAFQQANNRAILPGVVALACGAFGSALSLSLIFAAVIGLAILAIALLFLLDARRLRRLAKDASTSS